MSKEHVPSIEALIVARTGQSSPLKGNLYLLTTGDVMKIAIEFAKLHVEAALKAVVKLSQHTPLDYSDDDVIFNAYLPENIQ